MASVNFGLWYDFRNPGPDAPPFETFYADTLAHFRRVFVSHELGARKPEARAFRRVAREVGLAPERILFFDDLPENVAGAREAGMPGVVVSSPRDFIEAVRPWLQ